MKNCCAVVLLSSWCAFALSSPEPAAESAPDTVAPKIEVLGKASITEGQFVKCSYTYLPNGGGGQGYIRKTMNFRPWLNNAVAQVGIRACLNSRFSAIICPQIKLWDDTWDWQIMGQNGSAANPFIQHVTVSLADAEGIYSIGNKDAIAFNASVGVMPFKYNEDVKNLGEYLFRTGVHPAYIQTAFDYPYVTLTGIRLNTEMFNKLSVDVLFTQETQILPLNDWSLSVLAGYSVPGLLDIGAGVSFDRVIAVAGTLDRPVSQDTFYTETGDRDTLSWGGTKLMARISLDPKGILPSSLAQCFGKEDGRMYAEVAVLGTNSFSAYKKATDSNNIVIPGRYVIDSTMNFYSDISRRIPIMFGFNVPTFKLLDYLSIEAEWFGWQYSPSLYDYQNLVYTLPKPIIPQDLSTGRRQLYTTDNAWKYSFNFRKTMWGHLSIIGQIARDHTRHDAYYSSFADPEEAFVQKDQWGWWLKLQYNL